MVGHAAPNGDMMCLSDAVRTAPTGIPVIADIAPTLMPAASSGAILARLVSCSSRALDDANDALCVLMNLAQNSTRAGTQNTSVRFGGDLGGAIEGRLAMGWSMDRQGIRTSFDRESRRLKQVELSGLRRERVSLDTYANELSAREAEVCQEAKYGEWREPTNAAPAAGKPFDRVETQVRKRHNGRREGCENI
jgi:hypothetical protein